MTPVELHAALESLNLTHQQLARLLGYDERTMRYWLAGDRGIPSAVAISGAIAGQRQDIVLLRGQGQAPRMPPRPLLL